MLTEDDLRAVKALSEVNYIWLGGTDQKQDGLYEWSDGSEWGITNWFNGYGNRGDKRNCLLMFDSDKWLDWDCALSYHFICKELGAKMLTGNTSRTLKFTKDQLTFTSFTVVYRYTLNQQLLGSWQEKRMGGFRLSWFLQDSNGTRLTESKPDMPQDWKPESSLPRYHEQYLVNMVQLASGGRKENMTRKTIINLTIEKKVELIESGSLQYTSMCLGGQIVNSSRSLVFEAFNLKLGNNLTNNLISDDIETGFMMFSSMIYCFEPVALSQFLHKLLSTQSPRTIIQATVNIIQNSKFEDQANKKSIGQFYSALNKILHLKYGKILLAMSSPLELESMIAKDWPYFIDYSKEIEKCLSSESCQGVRDLVHSLGKQCESINLTILFHFSTISQQSTFQTQWYSKQVSILPT